MRHTDTREMLLHARALMACWSAGGERLSVQDAIRRAVDRIDWPGMGRSAAFARCYVALKRHVPAVHRLYASVVEFDATHDAAEVLALFDRATAPPKVAPKRTRRLPTMVPTAEK